MALEKEYKLINGHRHINYYHRMEKEDAIVQNSIDFYKRMDERRSIRVFSDQQIPKIIIDNLIRTAATAPSGAHKQPWTFCAVSNPKIKTAIRQAAEEEERESYENRMSDQWKKDLLPLATDMHKPFLEIAPWLIVVFKKIYDLDDSGNKTTNYYVNESVGIASGMLITAIHQAGLVTLTHTPSPMKFLEKILERPKNERAYLLLPVGYPEQPVLVPDIKRKSIEEVSQFFE